MRYWNDVIWQIMNAHLHIFNFFYDVILEGGSLLCCSARGCSWHKVATNWLSKFHFTYYIYIHILHIAYTFHIFFQIDYWLVLAHTGDQVFPFFVHLEHILAPLQNLLYDILSSSSVEWFALWIRSVPGEPLTSSKPVKVWVEMCSERGVHRGSL